ncbi:WAT1-related protein [Melia azedarach]|uniref:WAT1-related protein n=1 Tax=Melia azedarach TaxID=155640 RepID=A0ACC1Z126_MELAZ|nr:WAT1-related protein [Melia azedarach]
MSFIFLGDALYLGSVLGAVIICVGFYAVIWGKANEGDAGFTTSKHQPCPISPSVQMPAATRRQKTCSLILCKHTLCESYAQCHAETNLPSLMVMIVCMY